MKNIKEMKIKTIDYDWLIGLGLMFGLAFVFTALTFNKFECFLIWLTVFCGFVVWGGLLPLWVLVLCLISLSSVIFIEIKNKTKGDG